MRVEVIIRKDTIFLKSLKISISRNYAPRLGLKAFFDFQIPHGNGVK